MHGGFGVVGHVGTFFANFSRATPYCYHFDSMIMLNFKVDKNNDNIANRPLFRWGDAWCKLYLHHTTMGTEKTCFHCLQSDRQR
jgi:hypothetical protein